MAGVELPLIFVPECANLWGTELMCVYETIRAKVLVVRHAYLAAEGIGWNIYGRVRARMVRCATGSFGR